RRHPDERSDLVVPSKDTAAGGPKRGFVITAVIAALSLIAAIVMSGLWLAERGEADSVRAERASSAELDTAYREYATDVMTKLMTIRQETLQDDVDTIIGMIEGDFEEQFAPRRDSYEEVVETTGVVADGAVSAAAVETSSPDKAEVIMAIDQTIGNPKAEEEQAREYRIRVTVNRHDDGVMKVSGGSFIPSVATTRHRTRAPDPIRTRLPTPTPTPTPAPAPAHAPRSARPAVRSARRSARRERSARPTPNAAAPWRPRVQAASSRAWRAHHAVRRRPRRPEARPARPATRRPGPRPTRPRTVRSRPTPRPGRPPRPGAPAHHSIPHVAGSSRWRSPRWPSSSSSSQGWPRGSTWRLATPRRQRRRSRRPPAPPRTPRGRSPPRCSPTITGPSTPISPQCGSGSPNRR